jgi:hypothetical protein
MKPASTSLRLLVTSLLMATMLWGCSKGPKITVLTEEQAKAAGHLPVAEKEEGKSEAELRREFEERKKARENAPEPELNPDEPREKFELVWRMGKKSLDSIYNERSEMIALMKRMKFDDKREKKDIKFWRERMAEFGIGRTADEMETAATALCKLITDVRGPAKELIDKGTEPLRALSKLSDEYDARANARSVACETVCGPGSAAAKWAKAYVKKGATITSACRTDGGTAEGCDEAGLLACADLCDAEAPDKKVGPAVYQKEWDKLDEKRKRWSQPVKGGKYLLMLVKSTLEEAYVLAEHGPRRAQIGLRDCLTKVGETPLPFELAQTQLEKVLHRSKWYRDLR